MFNFDEIIAKIPAVEEYKRNHYYDSPCVHNELPDTAYIEVTDWQDRKGRVTASEMALLADFSIPEGKYISDTVKARGELPRGSEMKLARKFKSIKFNF